MIALSNRVHIFARPEVEDKLIEFFADILGCEVLVSGDAPGLTTPARAFAFANGASLSVEFTDDVLDEQQGPEGTPARSAV